MFACLLPCPGRYCAWLGLDLQQLLRALLLQAFYSVRSERQLMEQLDYNLLFRWFVGLSLDEAVGRNGVHQESRAPDCG